MEAESVYCEACGHVYHGEPGIECPCCEDALLKPCREDEAEALERRIEADPDVAGLCCPECEDSLAN